MPGEDQLPETDIDREVRLSREHELAKMRFAREAEKSAAYERSERRTWRGWVLVGVAIVSVIIGLGVVITNAVSDNSQHYRIERQQKMERQDKLANRCLTEGGSWVNENCIFSKESLK